MPHTQSVTIFGLELGTFPMLGRRTYQLTRYASPDEDLQMLEQFIVMLYDRSSMLTTVDKCPTAETT